MNLQPVKVAPHILDIPAPDALSPERLISMPGKSETATRTDETRKIQSPHVGDAIIRNLSSNISALPPDRLAAKLRKQLSIYNGIGHEYIRCFAGKTAALTAIFQTYLGYGLETVITAHADDTVMRTAIATGANIRYTEHENLFEPRVDEIIDSMGTKTRIVFIADPSWPAGAIWSAQELTFLLSYGQNTMFVVDESYFEFSGVTMLPLIDKFPNLTIMRSLSPAFGLAGADLFYVISDSMNWQYIDRIGIGFSPNFFAQIAGEAALNDLDFAKRRVESIRLSNRALAARLTEAGYKVIETPGDYLLVEAHDSVALRNELPADTFRCRRLEGIDGLENLSIVQPIFGIETTSMPPFVHTGEIHNRITAAERRGAVEGVAGRKTVTAPDSKITA